jgi:adenosylhomocysteine nucleosidase
MIAVTFALPSESSDFRRLLDERHGRLAILHTGVGAEACRRRIEPFLDSQRFDFLISSGFAGGVDPSLGVSDLVLAENFSDPELLARAREVLISQVARLVTADRIIESAAQREQFARQHDAAAVDMETEWIARACAARKIPLLSLRVISDTTAAPFPVPPAVLFDLERQKMNPARLAGHLLTHPRSIVRLIGFVRQVTAARHDLAAALAVLLRELR